MNEVADWSQCNDHSLAATTVSAQIIRVTHNATVVQSQKVVHFSAVAGDLMFPLLSCRSTTSVHNDVQPNIYSMLYDPLHTSLLFL